MAFIYKINNKINNKVYIGKTERSIDKRFSEHKNDSKKRKCEVRPLYRAMNKYGIENFTIELLKETDTPEADEIYYIELYNSYKYGYNATLGGDGARYADINIDELKNKYINDMSNSIRSLAKEYNHDQETISRYLKIAGVTVTLGDRTRCVSVNQIDSKTGIIVCVHETVSKAAMSLGMTNGSHISKCAQGKRKTAGGYCWEYV